MGLLEAVRNHRRKAPFQSHIWARFKYLYDDPQDKDHNPFEPSGKATEGEMIMKQFLNMMYYKKDFSDIDTMIADLHTRGGIESLDNVCVCFDLSGKFAGLMERYSE